MVENSSNIRKERYPTQGKLGEFTQEINIMHQNINDDNRTVTLQIKEEQLDIVKSWIQTGVVKVFKETFKEEKTFTVPVMREELVIEKEILVSPEEKHSDTSKEIIRIPLSEERVEFTKNTVIFEEVDIYKQKVEEIKHIEDILKREKVKVKICGNPRVINKSNNSK